MNVQRVVTIGLTAALVGASAGLHVSANPARGLPAAHRDIAAHIDAYEAKIAALSSRVCAGPGPTDATDLQELRDARGALRTDSANLIALLDREKLELADWDLPASQGLLLQRRVESEEVALNAPCPGLPGATESSDSVRSYGQPWPERETISVPQDTFPESCATPGPYDIFPIVFSSH